jgi:hypothetical protein
MFSPFDPIPILAPVPVDFSSAAPGARLLPAGAGEEIADAAITDVAVVDGEDHPDLTVEADAAGGEAALLTEPPGYAAEAEETGPFYFDAQQSSSKAWALNALDEMEAAARAGEWHDEYWWVDRIADVRKMIG